MGNTIKVLQINNGNKIYGGGSALLFNIYQNIDKSVIQFDFLTSNNTTYETKRNIIEDMGAHIYEFHIDPSTLKGLLLFYKKLRDFLKTHHYDIVHINTSDCKFGLFCSMAAKGLGIKIIFHSHNASTRKLWEKFLIWPLKWLIYLNCDLLLACSMKAAYNKFPKSIVNKGKVHIIKNGIDTQIYAYDKTVREQTRKNLNIQDAFVIGNVGRLSNQKNQFYLLKVFKGILNQKENSVLMLIGDGELKQELEKQASDLGILDKVLFLGFQDDVSKYYQAMDVFAFPSLYEGLGIALIEAQTSGLPCFINIDLASEVDITTLIHRLPIIEDPINWSNEILSYEGSINFHRQSYEQEIKEAGYSIQDTAKTLTELYKSLVNKK